MISASLTLWLVRLQVLHAYVLALCEGAVMCRR